MASLFCFLFFLARPIRPVFDAVSTGDGWQRLAIRGLFSVVDDSAPAEPLLIMRTCCFVSRTLPMRRQGLRRRDRATTDTHTHTGQPEETIGWNSFSGTEALSVSFGASEWWKNLKWMCPHKTSHQQCWSPRPRPPNPRHPPAGMTNPPHYKKRPRRHGSATSGSSHENKSHLNQVKYEPVFSQIYLIRLSRW